MAHFLAFPILLLLLNLQMVVVSSLPLLQGTADLMLIAVIAWSLHERVKTAWEWALIAGMVVGFISAIPFIAPLAGYLIVTGIAQLLRKRIWQMPILAMFITTVIGTLIQNLISIITLQLNGVPISWKEGITLVAIPSALLNLILSIPIYVLLTDLDNWVYPVKIEL